MPRHEKEIVLGLGAEGADLQELDELTRGLANELRRIEVRSVERLSRDEAPLGSKGDLFAIGWLAVTLTPIVATKVLDMLRDWIARAHGRTIKVTIGSDTIELSGATQKERETLLKKWLTEADGDTSP